MELEKKVSEANTAVVQRALKGSTPVPASTVATVTGTAGSGGSSKPAPPRTSCQPEFEDSDKPVDVARVVDLASVPVQDFHSTHQLLGCIWLHDWLRAVAVRDE